MVCLILALIPLLQLTIVIHLLELEYKLLLTTTVNNCWLVGGAYGPDGQGGTSLTIRGTDWYNDGGTTADSNGVKATPGNYTYVFTSAGRAIAMCAIAIKPKLGSFVSGFML